MDNDGIDAMRDKEVFMCQGERDSERQIFLTLAVQVIDAHYLELEESEWDIFCQIAGDGFFEGLGDEGERKVARGFDIGFVSGFALALCGVSTKDIEVGYVPIPPKKNQEADHEEKQ